MKVKKFNEIHQDIPGEEEYHPETEVEYALEQLGITNPKEFEEQLMDKGFLIIKQL